MKHRSLIQLLAGLALAGCQPAPPFRLADLTNEGRGKYWDEVYSTNIYGGINDIYSFPRLGGYELRRGMTDNCDYFTGTSQVIHYNNQDSLRITNRNSACVRYNPDNFKLHDSTLTFEGYQHKILTLNPQVMLLLRDEGRGNIISIYVPSRYQHKQITTSE